MDTIDYMPDTYEEYIQSDYVRRRTSENGLRGYWWNPATRSDFALAKESGNLAYLAGRIGYPPGNRRQSARGTTPEEFEAIFRNGWRLFYSTEPPEGKIAGYYEYLNHLSPEVLKQRLDRCIKETGKFPRVNEWLGNG